MTEKPRRAISPLAEVERETLEEGREWMRQRMERKLQRLADRQGAISPPMDLEDRGRSFSRGHRRIGFLPWF
jgi:hypothetical protein